MEMGLITATADHNPELQVYRSLDHMYSCKIIYFAWSLELYVSQNNRFDFEFDLRNFKVYFDDKLH